MIRTATITSSLFFLLAGAAFAQKGGKLPWERNPYAALKEARLRGVPALLYFTSKG